MRPRRVARSTRSPVTVPQARIVFNHARAMVEMDRELAERCQVYRDVIEVPSTESHLPSPQGRSAPARGTEAHLRIFDELHVQPNRELWDVMALASGARPEPLLVAITTAGVMTDTSGRDSLAYRMYRLRPRSGPRAPRGREFLLRVLGSTDRRRPPGPRSVEGRKPGLRRPHRPRRLRLCRLTTPENEFRTKRLNQWVTASPPGCPQELGGVRGHSSPIPDGADVVLGFDGTYNNDSHRSGRRHCGDKPFVDVVRPLGAPRKGR